MLEREHEYLQDKLDYPVETKNTDYKSAVRFDEQTDFATKLVKHILGFANSGGGYLIIGFKEKPNKSLEPDPAITDEIIASYEVTRLCQYVEKYLLGQDRIKIEVHKRPSSQGVIYPVISIGRFPEYPFVCTKDYISKSTGETILESGLIYIRTEGARTLSVKAPSEWRQLIRECMKASQEIEAKRPTEGGNEKEVKVAEIPQETEKPASIEKEPEVLRKDEEAEKQFFAWVKSEKDNAVGQMKSEGFDSGFFGFSVQMPYGLDKNNNTALLEIARKSERHNTGWPIGVVMTKPEYKPVPLTDGIRAIMNTGDGFDYWALNRRGHFFFIRSHQEDTTEQSLTKGKKVLWFDVAIWRISEIISYTASLCVELNLRQSDKIKLILSYEGLKDRVLSVTEHLRLGVYGKSTVDKYEENLELQVTDIMTKLKGHVYQIAVGLFELFDFFNPDRAVVDSIVDEFLNARK